MNPFLLHLAFDVLALAVAVVAGFFVYRRWFPATYKHPADDAYSHYIITLSAGSFLGAAFLGTLNLWVSGVPGFGRSILGAILGAIVAVEWYKARHGIRGSTGAALVVPLGMGIAVGRIGCFLTGIHDYTYGTATTIPWGYDFGDGVLRHPVQLYEAFSMAMATMIFLLLLRVRPQWTMAGGFYFFVAWYGLQRFGLEFLKPYGGVLEFNMPGFDDPTVLNVFHIGTVVLMAYAVFMLRGVRRAAT